jgi:phosphorylcholine metabolism protein LicD
MMPKEVLDQLYKDIGINDYHDEIKDKERYIKAIEKFYKAYPEYIIRLDYLNNLLLSRHAGETIKYKKMYEIDSLDPVKFLTPLLDEYGYDKGVLDQFRNKTIYNREAKVKLLERSEVDKLLKLLDEVVAILDKNKITYWLDGGTLLGACQNGKFIPWDDDIDLAIPDCDFDKVIELTKDKKYDYKIIKSGNKAKFKHIKNSIVKITDKNSGFFVDLVLNVKHDGNYYSNWKPYEHAFIKDTDLFPLKKIEFEGKKYNAPNNPIPFLNQAYPFWRHIYVCSHAHLEELKNERNRLIYYRFTTPYKL